MASKIENARREGADTADIEIITRDQVIELKPCGGSWADS